MSAPRLSFSAKMFTFLFKYILRPTSCMDTSKAWQKFVLQSSTIAEAEYVVPIKLKVPVRKTTTTVGEYSMPVFIVNGGTKAKKTVLYIHVGAYLSHANQDHWRAAERIAEETGVTVVIPMYPLAPVHIFEEAYTLLHDLYSSLRKTVGAQNIVLAGDSAGGALALGLCEELAKKGEDMPGRLILISPWVDATMSHAGMEEMEKHDPMLKRDFFYFSFFKMVSPILRKAVYHNEYWCSFSALDDTAKFGTLALVHSMETCNVYQIPLYL